MRIDLQKVTTQDGILLDGGIVWPRRKGKTAAILVHGLTGRFYGWLPRMEPLVNAFARHSMAFAVFNTRGNHTVTHLATKKTVRRSKKILWGGGGVERFEDCIHDIRAVIDFLSKNGYRRIVFLGHSTGANKVAYYCATTRDRRVRQLVLLSPIADPSVELREQGKALYRSLAKAREYVRSGRGDSLLCPAFEHLMMTPKRYLSLYTPGSREDVFPYYNPKGNWRIVERIRIPTFVVFGDTDQYLDRDVGEVMEAFEKHVRNFRGTIIQGADHSFHKREKELARVVMGFVHE